MLVYNFEGEKVLKLVFPEIHLTLPIVEALELIGSRLFLFTETATVAILEIFHKPASLLDYHYYEPQIDNFIDQTDSQLKTFDGLSHHLCRNLIITKNIDCVDIRSLVKTETKTGANHLKFLSLKNVNGTQYFMLTVLNDVVCFMSNANDKDPHHRRLSFPKCGAD